MLCTIFTCCYLISPTYLYGKKGIYIIEKYQFQIYGNLMPESLV
jgi:hypothetical protein